MLKQPTLDAKSKPSLQGGAIGFSENPEQNKEESTLERTAAGLASQGEQKGVSKQALTGLLANKTELTHIALHELRGVAKPRIAIPQVCHAAA